MPVGDQVVLAARPRAIDWRRSGVSPPSEPGRASRRSRRRPCPAGLPCGVPRGERHADGARRRPRSSPARAASTSPRCSRSSRPAHPPRTNPFATRRRSRAEPRGRPLAADPDTADAAEDEARSNAATRSHRSSGTRSSDTCRTLPSTSPTAKRPSQTHSEMISLRPGRPSLLVPARPRTPRRPYPPGSTPACAKPGTTRQWPRSRRPRLPWCRPRRWSRIGGPGVLPSRC